MKTNKTGGTTSRQNAGRDNLVPRLYSTIFFFFRYYACIIMSCILTLGKLGVCAYMYSALVLLDFLSDGW
jgi:hypothetical protein